MPSQLARQRIAAALTASVAVAVSWVARPHDSESSAVTGTTLSAAPPVSPTAPPSTTSVAPPTGTAPLAITQPAATSVAPTVAPPTASTLPAVPPTAAPGVAVAVGARPIPPAAPEPPPPAPRPPWADSTRTTKAGHLATDIGCAAGTDPGSLDAFFATRLGPLVGADYQHVYPLGGDRFLWLFQDAFIDHGGGATRLGQASFIHNLALEQRGRCFTMLHRGSAIKPLSFEAAIGEHPASWWFWPLGGELVGNRLYVFWAEMNKDDGTPAPGDGLGWHPVRTWLATYDAGSLARLSFDPAPNEGAQPLYGYAVASDDQWTYLFGNTFEQNLAREGGFWNGPHSGTAMYLARVPWGQLASAPEYRTADGWSGDAAAAVPIVQRFWTENPMQPRRLGGQWVSVAKIDGYWGEELAVDVAADPWGPWTMVERRELRPHAAERRIVNTYHAHLMPWLAGGGLVISVSQNARDMVGDAYPHPERYRAMFVGGALVPPPPPPPPETTTIPTTVPETTTIPTTLPTTVATTSTTLPPTVPTTAATTSTAAPTTTIAATTTTRQPTTTTRPATTTTVAQTTTSRPATTTTVPTTTVPTTTAPTTTAAPASTVAPAAVRQAATGPPERVTAPR